MRQIRSYTLELETIGKIEQVAYEQFGNNKSMALAYIVERGFNSWKEEKELLKNAWRTSQAKQKTKKSDIQN